VKSSSRLFLLVAGVLLLSASVGAQTRVFRFGTGLRIHQLHAMSDGSILGAGWSRDLQWIPKGVRTTQLDAGNLDSKDTTGRAVLVRWSAGFDSILWVAAFPKGTVGPLRRIRSSEQPGATTGFLFVSGDRTVSDPSRDGYFLARVQGHLDRNALPSIVWSRDVSSPPRRAGGWQGTSQYKSVQAWDVDNEGRVFLARGSEADYDSAEVVRFTAAGRDDLVAEFRSHVTAKGRVWRGSPAEFDRSTGWNDTLRYSRLFLKATDAQGPRTVLRVLVEAGKSTQLDTDVSGIWSPDSAAGLRRGGNPLDILFPEPCREYYSDPGNHFADSVRCPGGRGWSGLTASSRATARIGGLVVDRRTNRWALGLTWNALSRDGSSLDIPTVSVYESEGKLLWWSRLRSDATRDTVAISALASLSEIQSLAVGQTEHTTGQTLVVQARARKAEAFWSGDRGRLGKGWRRAIDGLPEDGSEASWLGKLTLVNGGFLSATWQAAAGSGSGGSRLGDFFGGWPAPGSVGEKLSNTSCHPRLGLDDVGTVRTFCQGERPLTTAGAFRSVAAPGTTGPVGWNVLTVWTPALDLPSWATAFDGARKNGDSGVAVAIDDHIPLPDGGELVVGHVLRASAKVAAIAAPAWADSTGDVVLGRLLRPAKVESPLRPRPLATPKLVSRSGRWWLQVPGEGDGSCRWIEPSGRLGGSIPLVDGEAVFATPPGAGMRHLLVERGGKRWIVPAPSVR
jgi:hypothetical protein